MAGAAFALRLAALTPADVDQQHIPTLLRNDPRIPDRSSAYMAGGENPCPTWSKACTSWNARARS